MDQIIQVMWRSALVFAVLVILSRAMGKKLLSQITFHDFVVAITVGTISGAFVVETVNGLWILASPVILTVCTIILGFVNFKSITMRKLTEGEPVIVIKNGKILEKNLKKLRYSLNHLESQLRDKNIFDIGQVEFAILEPHGHLSVLKKTQHLPLTPENMKIGTKYQGLSTEIIVDGKVMEKNLKNNKLSFAWLYQQLRKHNINKLSDVVYATLNTDGALYIDTKKEK